MEATHGSQAPPARGLARRGLWLGLVGPVALVVAVLVAGYVGGKLLPPFIEWVRGLGPWGPIAFILGYVVAVVSLLPAVVLTISAGVIFGLIGTLYVWIGATIGSILSFLISRHFARSAIERC